MYKVQANGRKFARALMASGSVMVLAALAPIQATSAQAQDNREEKPIITEVEEIAVIGQAISLRRAVDTKRNARNFLDASVQDDIGRLPDLNTASVIRRITGVAVQNDQAEARFPIVRGLNSTFNRTTIDGGVVASPERGSSARAVPLDVIPASLLARLEVLKSVTPELDANAIGGTINVVTRSAFDEKSPFLYASGFLGFHEQSGKGGTLNGGGEKQPWRVNFTGGQRFGADDEFGIVVGFDYSIRNFEIPQIEVDDADYTEFDAAGNNVGLGNGNGIIVPTNNRVFFYNNVRERIGGSLKLEWRPSDTLSARLSGLYTEFNDSERRDEFRYELGTSGSSSQPDTITDQTPTSGVTEDGSGIIGLGRFTLDRKIYNIQGDVELMPSDRMTVDARFTYSGAELDNPESTESFSTDAVFGARYETSSFFPRTFPLDPEGYFNPASYDHANRGELDRFAENDIFEAALDTTYEFDTLELKVGGQYRKMEKAEGFVFNRFVQVDGLGYTLADVTDNALSSVNFQGNYDFPFRVDSDAANAFFADNSAQFDNTTTVNQGSEAEEEVFAGYIQGTIDFEAGFVTGGVRIEHTKWDGGPTGGDAVSGSYTNILPSIVGRFEVSEDVYLRAAASRTLGRPDISDLTRGLSLNVADSTVSRSNPNLAPRKSTNLDLAVEWYVPEGIVSFGVFYKDISDEIFTLTSSNGITLNGINFETLTQPENASSAEILGLEAQYQQVLTFLPAPWDKLGVGANITILDTELEVPLADGSTRTTGLFQQPDLIYNLTGFYADENFEVRLSYNYTDKFLDALNANDPNRDEYWKARGQLDLQTRVNVTDNVSVVFEAVNLTDAGRRELTGPGQDRLQEDADFGRTFWIGANFAL